MKRGAHTLWDCHYHLVWCPKYRKDLFTNEWIRSFTWELFERIGEEYGVVIEAMEIASDHIHMMVEIPPRLSVSDTVKAFKSISAREIFEKFPGLKRRLWAGELWKDGYFVRSVGSDVTGAMVKNYIDKHETRARRPAQLRLGLKG